MLRFILTLIAAMLTFAVSGHGAPALAASPQAECLPNSDGAQSLPDCHLPIANLTKSDVLTALDGQPLSVMRDGAEITIYARFESQEPPELCCSLRGEMTRIGDGDLWAIRFRPAELDRAMLTFIAPNQSGVRVSWRGPDAPSTPQQTPQEDLQGEVIDRTLWSESLQETRKLQIYLPPGYDPSRTYPAIFEADGILDVQAIDPLIRDGAIEPVILIGMLSGQYGVVEDRSSLGLRDLRAADYLKEFPDGGGRFERHMRYVAEELVLWVRREYAISSDPADIAVQGYSNGAAFALRAGLTHPEIFGSAFVMSEGSVWLSDEDAAAAMARSESPARFILSAGLYEPGFHKSTDITARALRGAGFETAFVSNAAGHMSDQWKYMQARNLEAVFGTSFSHSPAEWVAGRDSSSHTPLAINGDFDSDGDRDLAQVMKRVSAADEIALFVGQTGASGAVEWKILEIFPNATPENLFLNYVAKDSDTYHAMISEPELSGRDISQGLIVFGTKEATAKVYYFDGSEFQGVWIAD